MSKNKELDYKFIGFIILISLAFSGAGYLLGFAIPYLLPSDYTESHCNDLNETSWHTSPIGDNYKTLQAYQNACKNIVHSIKVDQPKEIQLLMTIVFPIFVGLSMAKVFGIHKDDEIKK